MCELISCKVTLFTDVVSTLDLTILSQGTSIAIFVPESKVGFRISRNLSILKFNVSLLLLSREKLKFD